MHINTKLWEMGYGILRVPEKGEELECYRRCVKPVDFAEILASLSETERAAYYNLEHERWMAYVRTEGWRLASNGGQDACRRSAPAMSCIARSSRIRIIWRKCIRHWCR